MEVRHENKTSSFRLLPV